MNSKIMVHRKLDDRYTYCMLDIKSGLDSDLMEDSRLSRYANCYSCLHRYRTHQHNPQELIEERVNSNN